MNRLLARQLRHLGLDPDRLPDDPAAWRELLERVERSYDDADRGRYLLERSLSLSSAEMRSMYDELSRASARAQDEQETRLRAVVDSLDDGLCTLDLAGRVDFANHAAARLLGEPEGALLGATLLDRFRFWPDDPTDHLSPERVLDLVGRGHVFTDDTALLTRGPEDLPVSCVISPIGAPHEVRGLVVEFRDLSDRHRTLEAVRRTERHYRTLFHSIPIAVYEEDFTGVGTWLEALREAGVTDLRSYLEANPGALREAIGRIEVMDVNPAALDLVEADGPAQLVGPLNPDLFTEETMASVRDQLLAIWDGRTSVHTELTGTTLTGRRLDAIFHWSASLVGGRIDLSKVLVALTDITGRKAIEDQLADLVASKDRLIAAVSHELRTPLTSVYGGAEVLLEQWDELTVAERLEMLRYIVLESRELSDIVEDLLVAARVGGGSLPVSLRPIEVRVEVESALEAVRAMDGGESIDVARVSGSALADPLRFRQIVRNLLSNALRYGGREIAVEAEERASTVVLRVCDDGDGIPEERAEAVFDAYQGVEQRDGVPGSVGLGLTVSRQLAELMGGTLHYRRCAGLTVFELVLPAARCGIPLGLAAGLRCR